jgi:leucyl-tRNA synthetase
VATARTHSCPLLTADRKILVSPDASEKEAIALAKQTEVIQRYLENQEIRRIVYVPGRILNLVT